MPPPLNAGCGSAVTVRSGATMTPQLWMTNRMGTMRGGYKIGRRDRDVLLGRHAALLAGR